MKLIIFFVVLFFPFFFGFFSGSLKSLKLIHVFCVSFFPFGSVPLKSLDFNEPEKTTKKRKKTEAQKKWISQRISMHLKKQQKGKKTEKTGKFWVSFLEISRFQ